VRELRAVSAALPDVPGHGGGAVLAAWAHRCDAVRRSWRSPGRRDVPRRRRDLRAVSGLRAGVSEWRRVRCADGADPNGARRPTVDHAVVAADRIRSAGASSCPARRFDGAGAGATPPARAAPPRGAPPRAAPGGTVASDRRPSDQRRRVDLHGMCDGRMATLDPSQHGRPGGRNGSHVLGAGRRRCLLRCAARACRSARRRTGVGPPGDRLDARRRADPGELRRLWRRDEGLRRAAPERGSTTVQRSCARHLRVARRPRRRVAGADGPASSRDRAGSVPPPPRATRTRTGATAPRTRRRHRRSRRRRPVLWGGRRLLGAAARARRGHP
jgi:hypothetical protein